ncbi:MAG: C-terminal binding protein [Dehalococcoidia bacterium]
MTRFKVVAQKAPTAPQGSSSFTPTDFSYEEEALKPIGAEIVEVDAGSDAEFAEMAHDADAILVRSRFISAEIIASLDNCKVIGCGSIGTDRVDVDAATARGIPVTNVPDVFIEEVADHTMALLLAAHRHLYEMRNLIREGRWAEGHPYLRRFPRLFGQTLGLIAFGNVARAVARRAQTFGLRVISHDPYVSEVEMTAAGVEPASLMDLLARSDFVCNHMPLNESTRSLLGARHFAAMKPSAMFINTGRGPSHDEAALIDALRNGEIAGAGIDVFETEPADPGNPLFSMDNVIVTPHVASATARMMPETRRRLGQEIALVLQGRWPRSAVNPQALQNSKLIRWQPQPAGRGPNR